MTFQYSSAFSRPGAKIRHEYRNDEEFLADASDTLKSLLNQACRQAAPNQLFFGERNRLLGTPDSVLHASGEHVDDFLHQGSDPGPGPSPFASASAGVANPPTNTLRVQTLTDEQTHASRRLHETFQPQSRTANAAWLVGKRGKGKPGRRPNGFEKYAERSMMGVFKCQVIGLHSNHRWLKRSLVSQKSLAAWRFNQPQRDSVRL